MSNPEDKPIIPNDAAARQPAAGLSHELQSFEARLAKLSPRDDRLDRERLIFLAGQASITAANDATSLPALDWRRHPAWPMAFAGMSALAATLLAILLARPAVTDSTSPNLRDFASSQRFGTTSKPTAIEAPDQGAGILSPRDALHDDIETMLSHPVEKTAAWPNAVEPHNRPALTPGAWQQFSEGMVPSAPPAGSSYLPLLQGITS
jgi:hypothetical protein